jgi:glycosyltransferase involved in cell wall biosynthesis
MGEKRSMSSAAASSSSSVAWLPASPLEGWASMDRYWRELHAISCATPPVNLSIHSVLPVAPPQRSARAPRWRRMLDKYLVYPLRARAEQSRLCHVLDHSYAHLLRCLPQSARKIVTVFDLVPLEDPSSLSSAQVARFLSTVGHLRSADHLISISEETKKKLGSFLGIPEERVTVVLPGTDFATFQQPASETNPTRQKLARLPKVIFSVGSAIPRKNLHSMPAIFAHMRGHFQSKSCCFVRAGERLPEALRLEIIAITGEEGFIELGPLFGDDIIAAYQSARALIFPSTLEGLTFVIPEAMSAGCPVVTNTMTANPEAAGTAGLYYQEGDSVAAAQQLLSLLENDSVHAQKRTQGIERARSLTWRNHFDSLIDIYRSQLALS